MSSISAANKVSKNFIFSHLKAKYFLLCFTILKAWFISSVSKKVMLHNKKMAITQSEMTIEGRI